VLTCSPTMTRCLQPCAWAPAVTYRRSWQAEIVRVVPTERTVAEYSGGSAASRVVDHVSAGSQRPRLPTANRS
jgi:hypothetical protein